MPRAKGLGRAIPVVGVLDHGRARYAEFPRYLPVAQALAVELPDTPSDTHRCRHFLSSREPSVWLTGTRESIKEPDDAGVLIPPAPSPPIPSKLNAQSVQEQVPTVNTFIRSHTRVALPHPRSIPHRRGIGVGTTKKTPSLRRKEQLGKRRICVSTWRNSLDSTMNAFAVVLGHDVKDDTRHEQTAARR